MHRFYCEDLASGTLGPEESHHAANVLRLEAGRQCAVFNGRGREAKVELTEVTKKQARFRILSEQASPAPSYTLRLVQALPKRKSMEWIVQKITELGVTHLFPVVSERSVAQVDPEEAESKQNKWKAIALEACKQCGQNRLPEVAEATSVDAYLARQSAFKGLRLIGSLQPEAKPLHEVLAEASSAGPLRDVTFVVGPEGDISPAEMGKFRASGYLPVSLGPQVLRTETASLYLASVLLYELGKS